MFATYLILYQWVPTTKAFKNFKRLLNLLYNQAIYEGLVRENVAKMVDNRSIIQFCDQSLAHRESCDVLYTDKEIHDVEEEMWNRVNKKFSSLYPLATLLHMEIGCRPGELICLKWSDVDFKKAMLHIQGQQIEIRAPKLGYTIVDFTKNEKGISKGGRYVPLSTKALKVLKKLQEVHKMLGLESEWLFCDMEGNVLMKKGYFDFHTSLQGKFLFMTKSSYVFRRAFSVKLELAGIEPSERAAILGHSVDTNLKYYTFAKPGYLDRVSKALG